MLCPNCEAENKDDARFCDECGFPLSGSIARAGGAASPSRAESRFDQTSFSREPLHRDSLEPRQSSWSDRPSGKLTYSWDAPSQAQDETVAFEPAFGGLDNIEPSDELFDEPIAVQSQETIPSVDHFETHDEVEPEPAYEPAFKESHNEQSEFDGFFSDNYSFQGSDTKPFTNDPLDFGDDFWRDDNTAQLPNVAQGVAANQKNFRIANNDRGPGKGRLAVIIIGSLVALAAIVAIVGFALGVFGGKQVPDVTGLTEADARSVLEDEGFSVRTTQVKSDETEGLVLIMDPGAGSLAPEGSEVIIHIATARFIPELEGKTLDAAKTALEEAGYENVRYEVEYTDGEENVVLSVSPEAGTRAKSSMEVVVTYSQNYRVPDISGKDLDGATKAIEDAGLAVTEEYIDSDQYPDGTIIGTAPEAGTKVSKGDYVTITITRTRGVELKALTEELLSEGETVTIDGVSWQIESVMSISYQGDDTVAFTATGKPMVSVRGQTLVGSSETIDGTVVWSSDNEVVSIG